MVGRALILLLGLVLAAAVGILLIGAGRMLHGVARYYLRERRRPAEFRHPSLGKLTGEAGFWTGLARSAGRRVRFTVAGDDSAPHEALLQRVQAILPQLPEFEARSLAHLRSCDPDLGSAALAFYGLELTQRDRPDRFTFEFATPGAADQIWRVDWEGGQPIRMGFDD